MELWNEEINSLLLTIPFSLHSNLVLKIGSKKDESGNGLIVVLSDLEKVYIELLNSKSLINRIKKSSIESQSQSQSQSEQAQYIEKSPEEVIKELVEGGEKNKLIFNSNGFEHVLSIHLPTLNINLKFILDELETQDSTTFIRDQLLTPLLGITSILTRLLTSTTTSNVLDEDTLTTLIDDTGKIERLKPGTTLQGFFKSSAVSSGSRGNDLLGRFSQRMNGKVKLRDLIPIQFHQPKVTRSTSPSSPPLQSVFKKPSPSASTSKLPPHPLPLLNSATSNFAQQILRGTNTNAGEKISWDETQLLESNLQLRNGNGKEKGKEKERNEPRKSYEKEKVKESVGEDVSMTVGTAEEEPSTQEESMSDGEGESGTSLPFPPPQQPTSSPLRSPSPSGSLSRNLHNATPSPTTSIRRRSTYSQSQSQSQSINSTRIPSTPVVRKVDSESEEEAEVVVQSRTGNRKDEEDESRKATLERKRLANEKSRSMNDKGKIVKKKRL